MKGVIAWACLGGWSIIVVQGISWSMPWRGVLSAGAQAAGNATTPPTGTQTNASTADLKRPGDALDMESYLSQLYAAQRVVDEHSTPRAMVAVKFQSASVILTIQGSKHNHLARDPPVYKNRNLLAGFIGREVDCRLLQQVCEDWDRDHFHENQEHLTARMLALLLADEAQQVSLVAAQRPLAVNAVLLDRTAGPGSGDIYLVDVSGNYYYCRAGAVGHGCEQMNSWLESEGRALSGRLLQERAAAGNESSSADDMEDCLEVCWQCLLQGTPALKDELVAGNCTLHISSFQSQGSNGEAHLQE